MGTRGLRHLRANAIAYLALFVAMGGTTYAAIRLPANSVGTKQLRSGAVTGAKVAKDTLTGANINASTLGTVPAATNATHATTAASAAAAADASALGGQAPSAFQSRVSGACASGSAIASIAAAGTVSCQAANITQMTGGSAGNVSAGTQYLAPVGLSTPNGTEANIWLQSSNLAGTAGNLSGETATAVPSDVTFTLDVNGAPTSLSCTIQTGGSICSDSGHTVAIPPGDYVDISVLVSSVFSVRATFGWTETS